MIRFLIVEYGLLWCVNRLIYLIKLKLMRIMPFIERVFERKVNIKRCNIFSIEVTNVENFLNNIENDDKKKIIMIADNAIEGKINVFSNMQLDYGKPINWHYNPMSDFTYDKNIKWFKINDFNINSGDIKVVWEVSRFTHFFYFSRAYIITKDIKYYNAFSEQLDNWLIENKYSYGVNYKCGQEATIRMINCIINYSIFNFYKLTNKKDKDNMINLIRYSYKKILSNFFYAYKCIKNNHTLSEIVGLIVGAWCSCDNVRLKKYYKLLEKEIKKQFFDDGGYIQYSFNYQRYSLQLLEFILSIRYKTGIDLSYRSKELIKKSVLMMYQIQDYTGDVPNYGYNDGTFLFPVTMCGYRDFRSVLNTVYYMLEGENLYTKGKYDEELFWFVNDYKSYKKINKSNKKCEDNKDNKSKINKNHLNYINSMYSLVDDYKLNNIIKKPSKFEITGLYTLRHNLGFIMIILNNYKARPSHMDQLHIDLWYKGINIFCDSGTYSYADNTGDELTLTQSHNTVVVDNKNQMCKHGVFIIYKRTYTKNIIFRDNYFEGTMVSKNGYSHTRTVNKINDNNYVIKDKIDGKFKTYKSIYNTPCVVKIKKYGLDLYHKNELIVKIFTKNKIQVHKRYRSLYYLDKELINQIYIYGNKDCSCKVKIELISNQKGI